MPTIAIVEDEELIRTMITINLEKGGYQVEGFLSGEEFLEADPAPFDAILLDIMLPGMTGSDVLSHLRARGLETPIMMVSAKSDTETKVDALELGADDYLAKPFDMEELLVRVKALLRRQR